MALPAEAGVVGRAALSRYGRPLAVAALSLPTILLALWAMIRLHYSGLYGQDPFAYNGYAVGPLRHTLLTGAPLPAFFWPLGYPLAVALASLAVGTSLAAQTVSLMTSAASVALLFILGRNLLRRSGLEAAPATRAAVIGALLFAVSGRTLEAGTTALADGLAVTAFLLALVAVFQFADRVDGAWAGAALSGGVMGWAIVSRWSMAVLVPLWLLVAWRLRPAGTARFLTAALVAGGTVVGAQLILAWTVRPSSQLASLPFIGDLTHFPGPGWSPYHLFERSFFTADGAQHYAWPNALFYLSGLFHLQYLTPLWLPAVLLGAWTARRLTFGWVLLAWPVLVLLLAAGLPEQNARFILPALPPAALLAGLGLVRGAELIRASTAAVFLATAAGILVVAMAGVRDLRLVAAEQAEGVKVATWAAARIPAHVHTLAFEITATLNNTTRLQADDLADVSTARLDRLLAAGPVYLVVRPASLRHQWHDRPPGRRFRALGSTPGLRRLADFDGYVLYRTRGP